MQIRLALAALLVAAAMTACDESAKKPTPAAKPAGGAADPHAATSSDGTAAAGQSKPGTTDLGGGPVKPSAPKPASGGSAPATVPATGPAATPAAAVPAATPALPAEPLPPGVLKHTETNSGLIIDDLKFGDGIEAKPHQTVTIHYRGTLANGAEFDSSYKNGSPATFGLDNLIKGWQEGIPGMKVGGKRRLIVPPDLGYGGREIKGPNGQVLIPANSMLIFEIELFGVQ